MKAVILAAGEGMRMRPLTETIPKPMLHVAGKPLIEHVLETFPKSISEFIFVIGYLGDQIQGHLGMEWSGRKIIYVTQNEKKGTGHALSLCEPYLKGDDLFMLSYADDLHGAEGVRACVDLQKPCLLVSKVKDPRRFGVIEVNSSGRIIGIEEKPGAPKSNLISSGILTLPRKIFSYPVPPRANGEVYITDQIARMIKDNHKFYVVHGTFWHPIGYPEDLKTAEKALSNRTEA